MFEKNVPLNDFVTLQRGFDLPKKDRLEGNVPVVASTGIGGYHNEAKVKAPGVVIGRSGSIGGGQYIRDDFWPLNTSLWVKDFKGHDPRYVYYLFRSIDFKQFNVGTGVPTLNRNHLSSIFVSDIGISREKQIAKIIGDLDDRIELNRQINQTLEHIAQTIFKSWFVDFEPTRAKVIVKQKGGDEETQALAAQAILCGAITLVALNALADEQSTLQSVLNNLIHTKLAAQNVDKQNHNWLPEQLISTAKLFPNQLVDSELGKIPDGWKIKKVSDILARLKPKKRYTKKQVKEFGNIPIFEQGIDILMGFHCEKPGFIASPEKPLFIFGDHTCVTHLSCQPFDISQNVIPLMGNGYPTLWVYYAIQNKQEFQEYRRHWSEFIIKNVITPKVLLTEAFTDVVTALYIKKEQSLKESMVLQQLRDTLLPKLLSGELSVDTEQFDELQNDRVSA